MVRKKKTSSHMSDIDISEYSRDNAEGYAKQLRSKRFRKRALITVLSVLVALIAGGGIAAAMWIDSVEARMNDSAVVDIELTEQLAAPEVAGDPYYVLLLGTDGRPGETTYRSDTIILTRVDPKAKTVTMLSFPRDTRVVYRNSYMKLTEVHAYGGAAGMVEAVSELAGVPISHYAEVNFDGLATIANALGGVTVDVDVDMFDNKNFSGVVSLSAGEHVLWGEEALFYCRCRAFPDGDFTRMRHQRTFIKAVINQVMSSFDPAVIVNVIDACADMLITDLSVTDIIGIANEMRGIDTEAGIMSAQVPGYGTMINGISFVIVSQADIDRYMEVVDAGGDPAELDTTATYDSSIDYGSSEDTSSSETTYSYDTTYSQPESYETDYTYTNTYTETTSTSTSTDTGYATGTGDTGYTGGTGDTGSTEGTGSVGGTEGGTGEVAPPAETGGGTEGGTADSGAGTTAPESAG